MKKIMITASVIAMILTAVPAFADWESSITATSLNAGNRLLLGQKASALDGMDGACDVPAMLAGEIRAYFRSQGRNLWRDIRDITGPKEWELHIETAPANREVTLRWDPGTFPEGLVLGDPALGNTVDMRMQSQYTYRNTGPKTIKIKMTHGEVNR